MEYLLQHTLLGHDIVPTKINSLRLSGIPRIPRSVRPGSAIIIHICHIDGHISRTAELTLNVVVGFDLEGGSGAIAHGGGSATEEQG